MPRIPVFLQTTSRRRTSNRLALLGAVATGALAAAATQAADNPGAHQHGQARLQLAVEDNRVDLLFASPAYNLTGFEYLPRTEQERQELQATAQWLEKTPLVQTRAGSCQIVSASVQVGAAAEPEHPWEDQHPGHHDSQSEGGHREFEVAQQLRCPDATSGDWQTPLLLRFERLQALVMEWVTVGGQGSTRLSAGDQVFELKD